MASSMPLAELIGQPLPDITLPAADGTPFAIRGRVGHGPLVLFMYIRNGTPG
jgi:peroxiredoxin